MKLLLFTFLFLASLALYAQKNHSFEVIYGNDYTKIEANQKWFKSVQSFKLNEGNNSNLVYNPDSDYPQIFDTIDGIAFEFKCFDIDGDGKTELLVFYHSGANAYNLKIYEIRETADANGWLIIPWKDQVSAGNQYSAIDVSKGEIVIYSKDYSLRENDDKILRIEYEVKPKKLKLKFERQVKSVPAKN